MTPLDAGDRLDEYQLDSLVASSGMASVFRATDLRDGAAVAIKVPHPEAEMDPIFHERFRREIKIGTQLQHHSIRKIFPDDGQSRLYMAMEWLDGDLLRQVLATEGRFSIQRAVWIAMEILVALDYMHGQGVVHRDLKPENVMLDGQDRIKIIDFGIALKEDARRITQTSLTPALGTPDYISPEQVKGQRGDQRSDIYALGAMLYEMLTGQPPFTGQNPLVVLNERVLSDPKPARELNAAISPQLQEILSRALERDPRHRYSTAADMVWELEHQELVGVDDGERRPSLRSRLSVNGPKLAIYAGLALIPVVLFVLMLLQARK